MFKDNRGEKAILSICGNKSDCIEYFVRLCRKVNPETEAEIKRLTMKNGMKYFQTSAKTGNSIEQMFYSIIDDIADMQQARKKKIQEEEVEGPLTYEPLKSGRKSTACPSEADK